MTNAYIVTGTLADGKTVLLDESVPLPAGKVRVTVEAVAVNPAGEVPKWVQVLNGIWASQSIRGHNPMTVAEVEAYRNTERASWGEP